LPVAEVARILRDVADALAFAHERGVVHRDIKPDNVLLSGRHAVVTDFGVAKAVSEATGRQQLTTAGIALGTPAYMAPEQASADPNVDHRADIYALGALAYELLTGQPPFTGTTPQAVLASHVGRAPVPVTDHREAVPPALAQLVMRCLEKKAADRWQSAEELVPVLDALATPSGGLTATGMTPTPQPRPGAQRLKVGAAVLVGVIMVGALGLALRPKGEGSTPVPDDLGRVAVLRFDQAGASADDEYFGDGIAQDINIQLQKVGGFTVIAHGSSRQYSSAETSYSDIASVLGAQYIIDGSIRRASDQVRISVSLIDPATNAQLWAEDFTANLSASDIFEIQSEIAGDVATALGTTFGGEVAANPTADIDAYNSYLLGRFHWAQRTPDGVMRAIEHFSDAIAIDSSYALAWSGLADAYGFVPWYAWGAMDDAPALALAAAERAFALDSAVAETAASLAIWRWEFDWDFDAAERLFQRAIALNDQYAAAQAWYGSYLVTMGKIEEGLERHRRAISLDPLMANWYTNLAQGLVIAGREAEAVEPFRRWEELNERPNELLGITFQRLGRDEDATRLFQEMLEVPDTTVAALLHLGDTALADALLARGQRMFASDSLAPMELAQDYAFAGRVEEVFPLLERAVEARDPRLTWYWMRYPWFDSLRSDTRFREILRRIGLPTEGMSERN
jgi:serine/threonine-protein kinase